MVGMHSLPPTSTARPPCNTPVLCVTCRHTVEKTKTPQQPLQLPARIHTFMQKTTAKLQLPPARPIIQIKGPVGPNCILPRHQPQSCLIGTLEPLLRSSHLPSREYAAFHFEKIPFPLSHHTARNNVKFRKSSLEIATSLSRPSVYTYPIIRQSMLTTFHSSSLHSHHHPHVHLQHPSSKPDHDGTNTSQPLSGNNIRRTSKL